MTTTKENRYSLYFRKISIQFEVNQYAGQKQPHKDRRKPKKPN